MILFAKPVRRTCAAAAGLVAMALAALPASAGPSNPPGAGYITSLGGGWNVPTLLVVIDMPFYNPDNCASTDAYIIPDNIAANQLLTSLAITAYSMHKKVSFTVSGCYEDRPQIIGFTIIPG